VCDGQEMLFTLPLGKQASPLNPSPFRPVTARRASEPNPDMASLDGEVLQVAQRARSSVVYDPNTLG